jgi:predicted Fe-S protein YdhL (DUF1289 family)
MTYKEAIMEEGKLDLQTLEARFESLQWEFRFHQERMNVLQLLAQNVQREIEKLKAEEKSSQEGDEGQEE